MSKILGLDLGTNSIGWALIDTLQKQIIATGVRIFPEGVNRDNKGKEQPKNMQRRTKRQVRRLLFRSKYRKWLLANNLMQHNMFPIADNIRTVLQQEQLSPELRDFFSINPYEQRSRAYNGEKLSLLELGRVLYHFAQRRGYKESLKNDNEDEGVIYDGSIKDGKQGINETESLITQYGTLGNALFNTNPHITRWRNRFTSRRMYTDEFEIIWENQKKYYPEILTDGLRQKIGDATEGILFFQRPLKPQSHLVGLCTLEQREITRDGKKILVGKKRCSDSCIAFELRRTYEFINSIRLDSLPLATHQRETIKTLFFSKDKFLFSDIAKKLGISTSRFNYEADRQVVGTKSIATLRKIFTPKVWDEKTLEEQEEILNIKKWAEDKEKTADFLNKKYGLTDKQIQQFLKFRPSKGYSNLSYKATLNILPFLQQGFIYNEAVWLGGIRNVFDCSSWQDIPESKQDYIIDTALEMYHSSTDPVASVKEWLQEEFGFTRRQLEQLYHHSLDFFKGDGSLMELPVPENVRNPVVQQALYELRQLVNAVIIEHGKPDKIRIELSRELKSSREDRDEFRLRQYRNEQDNDAIKTILDEYNRPHTLINIQKLKLYREIERKAGNAVCPYTGQSVAIHQLWNGEVDVEHIIPYSICIDDSLQNKTLCFRQFNNRKGNRIPSDFFLKELGKQEWANAKERALAVLPYHKYKRFIDEKPQSLEDFEQRKLNDNRYISRTAKAYLEKVCKDVSVTQGELTAKLRHYWGLDGLLNPPINAPELIGGKEYFVAVDDTNQLLKAIMWQAGNKANKASEEKLAKLGIVFQGIVRNGKIAPYKTRYDHRHHAVDALTIAWTERRYLQTISTLKAKVATKEEWLQKELSFPEPWQGYFQQAQASISGLTVSHKKQVKTITRVSKTIIHQGRKIRVSGVAVRGALHAETVLGKRKDVYGSEAFHIRKHLSQVTKKAQVNKIADPVIKKLVESAIIETWQASNSGIFDEYYKKGLIVSKGETWIINPGSKVNYDVPDGAFFQTEKDEKGKIIAIAPKVFLPKGEIAKGVPIQRVRLRENSANAVQLKGKKNQWVEPGNNFGVLIYECGDDSYKEKIITFWEAVESVKQKTPAFALPPDGRQMITTLQINDLFLIGISEDELNWHNQQMLAAHLYRVQKLSSFYYVFRKASAATLDFESEQKSIRSLKAWRVLNPIKVKVDILGKVVEVRS